MKKYKLFLFKNRYDNYVDHNATLELTLDEYVEVLMTHNVTSEKDSFAFIGGEFKTAAESAVPVSKFDKVTKTDHLIPNTISRTQDNLKTRHSICVDFDEGVTMAEVREKFKKYLHVGYTSFNHMRKGEERFRVVFPLDRSYDREDIQKREKALLDMFIGCDKTTFVFNRIFYLPSYDNTAGIDPVVWKNEGEFFDLFSPEIEVEVQKTFVQPQRQESHDRGVSGMQGSWRKLDLYSLFQAKGMLRRQVRADQFEVLCPNHHNHTGGGDAAGISYDVANAKWRFKCFHSHCKDLRMGDVFSAEELAPFYLSPPPATLTLVTPKSKLDESDVEEVVEEVREVVKVESREFSSVKDFGEREGVVKLFVNKVMKEQYAKHHVLQTPEGYGKSTMLMKTLRAQLQKVMFLCSSNAQANEKFKTFNEKYSAQRVWSFGALLEHEHGVEAVYEKADDESVWSEIVLDEDATVEAIADKYECSDEEALKIFNDVYAAAKRSKVLTADVVVSTFAMGSALLDFHRSTLDYVIIVDDPNTSDLLTSVCGFINEDDDTAGIYVKETRDLDDVIFGTEYLRMPPVIWTTTENCVVEMVKTQHSDARVTSIVENIKTNGSVIIHDTTIVRKKYKKVIPSIADIVADDGELELGLISNGVQAEFNLVNSKGRNDLNVDNVIVSSCLHPLEVASLAVSLGLDIWDARYIESDMVVDVINQAIGRSQGYRAEGRATLVLCDLKQRDLLISRSRYELLTIGRCERRKKTGILTHVNNKTPDWITWFLIHVSTWQKFIQIIDGAVFNTRLKTQLDVNKIELAAISEAIEEYNMNPNLFLEGFLLNSNCDDISRKLVEGIEARLLEIKEAAEAALSEGRSLGGKNGGKVGGKIAGENRTGKRVYVNRKSGERKMFEEGKQPRSGWKLAAKKKN